ncbi:calcium binding egf domain-containing protein [Cystoisospora suis]|uniref:Calcium binding egf domain-containing protein n=1 Tax=Cystoisospora suis TaxID=483139 RepID=A0A2C6KRN1_9APIC|nr:calcium binding egf domain-containing protein [Cystoisospora suis]
MGGGRASSSKKPPGSQEGGTEVFSRHLHRVPLYADGVSLALRFLHMNECQMGENDCQTRIPHSICKNTYGSYECVCSEYRQLVNNSCERHGLSWHLTDPLYKFPFSRCENFFCVSLQQLTCAPREGTAELIHAASIMSTRLPLASVKRDIRAIMIKRVLTATVISTYLKARSRRHGSSSSLSIEQTTPLLLVSAVRDKIGKLVESYLPEKRRRRAVPHDVDKQVLPFSGERMCTKKGGTDTRNVDECETRPCSKDRVCVNTPGSYKCECPQGYSLHENGECVSDHTCTGDHSCDPVFADCIQETPTSYSCKCKEHLEGNGKKGGCKRKSSTNTRHTLGTFFAEGASSDTPGWIWGLIGCVVLLIGVGIYFLYSKCKQGTRRPEHDVLLPDSSGRKHVNRGTESLRLRSRRQYSILVRIGGEGAAGKLKSGSDF